MRVLIKLAVRNLLAAGLRTWLNVIVLSLTFVVIIAAQGLFRGLGDQAARASIDYEFGGGQFWHQAYDPYDPLTIQDAHGPIPPELEPLIATGQATPILIIQGTLYPQGRFLPVLIKGIDPAQNILKLPSQFLAANEISADRLDKNLTATGPAKSTPLNNEAGNFISATGPSATQKEKHDQSEPVRDANQASTTSPPTVPNTVPITGPNTKPNNAPKITSNQGSLPGSSPVAAQKTSNQNQAMDQAAPSSRASGQGHPASVPDEIPAIIGTRLATSARLSVGDTVILRWRDAHGAFDARTIRIVHVFRTIVQSVDAGQVWLPLPVLQSLAGLPGEATIITLAPGAAPLVAPGALTKNSPASTPATSEPRPVASDLSPDSSLAPGPGAESRRPDENRTKEKPDNLIQNKPYKPSPAPTASSGGWVYRDQRYLLRDIDQLVAAKTAGSTIIYVILLFMSLLAIFDTQVLNIFHRIKEIGTLVALGLTRRQIVLLFTLEGTLHAVLAAILAALYGYPLLSAFARTGWKMPEAFDSFGVALGERLVPVFTGGIIIGTVILIMSLTALISFMPARKLSRLRPTDALRGKLQ